VLNLSQRITQRFFHLGSSLLLPHIRNELLKYEGGLVELDMDNITGIAIMTLNNPKRMNAMTGADLSFVKKALHYGEEMATYQHDTLTRLLNLPLISVALIQGHTLGGGAELCTACDFRVMSPKAKIGFVHLKMGLTTAWGAATRLTKLLGHRKTLDLLCSAKILLPSAALRIGLVDYVLPEDVCIDELQETKKWLLENFCAFDTGLVRDIKSLVVSAEHDSDIAHALEKERKLFARTWGGPAQLKALAANIKHKGPFVE
ncbi:enoyl CoA hydratase domain-containing protein 1, partial [Bulinus truncatus]